MVAFFTRGKAKVEKEEDVDWTRNRSMLETSYRASKTNSKKSSMVEVRVMYQEPEDGVIKSAISEESLHGQSMEEVDLK
jgi:hypothetical protein